MEAILNRIESFKKSLDINKTLETIFKDSTFQQWLLDIIRWNQLFEQGVTEENTIIGTYSPFSEMMNPEKKTGTHFTLRDTGAFYESMKVYVNADNIVIDAEGDKTDPNTGEVTNLFEEYGKAGNLLGLTEKNWNEMIEKLKPLIIEQIWKSIAA